ncbi:MAG: DUF2180 family protein [Planctomycetes bacterium]|nr:DUF2180 family protein [Planctomycetota bacterium]
MNCYQHGQTGAEFPAIGSCVDCGVGVCVEHSDLIEGTRHVATGNLMQARGAQDRSLVCLFDAAGRAGSDAARAV